MLFWGIKAYIDALEYKSSASLKTSLPHGLPLWGKEYGPGFQKCKNFRDGLFIGYRASRFTKSAKCKNDERCRRSRSAPAPCLRCRPSERILVWFFLPLQKVHSIWASAFRRLPCAGFAAILYLQLRCAFALLSYISPCSYFILIRL
jgi:hypothetical protein